MKTELLSKCHGVPVKVHSSDEGTNYYCCTKCGKATDPVLNNVTISNEDTSSDVSIVRSINVDKKVAEYLVRAENIAAAGGWLSSPHTSTSLIIRIASMIQKEEHKNI